jgi:hypothetical protein
MESGGVALPFLTSAGEINDLREEEACGIFVHVMEEGEVTTLLLVTVLIIKKAATRNGTVNEDRTSIRRMT